MGKVIWRVLSLMSKFRFFFLIVTFSSVIPCSEEFSDEEFSDEKMSSSDSEEDEDKPSETARRAAMDMLVPSLEPSEYGKMPASFHANSQRVAPTMETGVANKVTSQDGLDKATSPKESPIRPIRQPILPRDKYDGVDSDDETDGEDGPEQDDESEEEQPQIVGEVEVDMSQEEEEFLEFSRQALGISDEQWGEIVRDRKGRGGRLLLFYPRLSTDTLFSPAFVPSSAANMLDVAPKPSPPVETSASVTGKAPQGRPPAPGPRPNVNPNLDSFEAVMQAMDAELARTRMKTNSVPEKPDKGKGKEKTATVEDEGDIEAAMDIELKSMLENSEGDEGEEGEEPVDYNLIKNFLESFKSQAGLSGPVSNLAGRLQPGWQLPRDEA